MQTLTKAQFEKIKDNLKIGGDFWNADKIWRIAFTQYPEAKIITRKELLSGLYCDLIVDGKECRIYS